MALIEASSALVSFVTGPAGFEVRWPDGEVALAGSLMEAMALAYARLPVPAAPVRGPGRC